MSAIRFAVMGCGRISRRHTSILASLAGAELVGVCDVLDERARTTGARHGVPWFTDAHAMVRELRPDAVCVLTPSGLHAEHARALAPHVPNLVVEKPMALRVEDADAMIRRCEQTGSRLFVVLQNRFNRPVVRLREALDEGRFGRLLLGTIRVRWSRDQAYYDLDDWRGSWGMDGGVMLNQAIHHLDLLEWTMGEAATVRADTATQLVDTEAPNTAVATLRFRNGALGVIEATTATRPTDLEGSLSVLGEGGSVEIAGFAVNRLRSWAFSDPRPGDRDVLEHHSENPPDQYGYGHHRLLRQVVDAITHDRPAPVDGHDARRSLELAQAVYQSARENREIEVHPR